MKVIPTAIDGLLIVEPDVYGDRRGFFMETWRHERYKEAGILTHFVQDNLSFSVRGTLRGLHYQIQNSQAKLIMALTGDVFDVAVDLRPDSPTFGKWEAVRLTGENHRQLYIPEGFAHGFCVLSETAHFLYKCSRPYRPHDEAGIPWNDPDIGIEWPVSEPILSDKDLDLPRLREISRDHLPHAGRSSD